MWFGTREYMQEVPDPAINYEASRVGWATKTDYLNGRAWVRRSTGSHREYNLSWNLTSPDALRPIMDYADGLYGDGPIYWIDKFASGRNLLAQHWAAPMQALDDGPLLAGDDRPESALTNYNTLGYPIKSAEYNLISGGYRNKFYLPIPPGYTAWFGVHGSITSGSPSVQVTPYSGATVGSVQTMTLLGTNDPKRVNASFSSDLYTGVEISLAGIGRISLSGMMLQLLPNGATPPTGGFISGQGHSGCTFESQPVLSQYSAVLGRDGGGLVGLSAKLVETGS